MVTAFILHQLEQAHYLNRLIFAQKCFEIYSEFETEFWYKASLDWLQCDLL